MDAFHDTVRINVDNKMLLTYEGSAFWLAAGQFARPTRSSKCCQPAPTCLNGIGPGPAARRHGQGRWRSAASRSSHTERPHSVDQHPFRPARLNAGTRRPTAHGPRCANPTPAGPLLW